MACVDCQKKRLKALTDIGPFQGVMQIVPTQADIDLLTNPAGAGGIGSGDLVYHGGKTIVGGRLINVYLGTPSFDPIDFDAFTKTICEQGYYLSPDSKDATSSKFGGSVTLTSPFGPVVDDLAIQVWLDSVVGTKLPADDGATMYALIFPAGTTVNMGGESSCSSFCGYHSKTVHGHYYQVIDDTSCSGCHGSFTPAEGRMMVHAHEYGEWRSDPDGNAWFDSTGYENADKCAWQKVAWGPAGKGWAVQPMWVNGKGCYTGTYVDVGPPPVPVPVTSKMVMSIQPQGGPLSQKLQDFSVALLDQNGALNVADSTTVVSTAIQPGGYNPRSVKAVAGIVSFPGDTFQTHTGTFHYHFTSGTMVLDSNDFIVAAAPPPPPPTGYTEVKTPWGSSFAPKVFVQGAGTAPAEEHFKDKLVAMMYRLLERIESADRHSA